MARAVVGALVTGALALGCREDPRVAPPVSAASSSVRYLALGDSFTIGTGGPSDAAFPSKLAARWRGEGCAVELENAAVNGYATQDLVREELPRVAAFRPTFVTLAIGANDVVRRTTEEDFRTNLRHIFDVLSASRARIVVLPQPRWARSPAAARFGDAATLERRAALFDAILRQEALARGAEWIELGPLLETQAAARKLAFDGLHPNGAAYAEWADAIGPRPNECGVR